jgi:hypothetical protein
MAWDVFISHSRASAPEVRKLADALRAHGLSTWWDGESLTAGQDWGETIKDALAASRAIVFVIEPGREPGRELRNEWSEALEAAWAQPGKRLIPLLLADAKVPPFLQNRRAVRVEEEPRDWERAARDLAKALRAQTGPQDDSDRSGGEEARAEWLRRRHELELAANELRPRE